MPSIVRRRLLSALATAAVLGCFALMLTGCQGAQQVDGPGVTVEEASIDATRSQVQYATVLPPNATKVTYDYGEDGKLASLTIDKDGELDLPAATVVIEQHGQNFDASADRGDVAQDSTNTAELSNELVAQIAQQLDALEALAAPTPPATPATPSPEPPPAD
ncbi:MAG: hypothetical protein AAFY08_14075 [Planctomycetota bacterium]